MANVLIDNTKLTALGNAIRAKTGKSDLMTVSQMATEVASISGGASLEYVTDASGTTAVITGTEISDDKWIRPSNWPDLSSLDRTGEVVYITCMADEIHGYIELNCHSNVSTYVVELGNIVDGEFVSEYSWSWTQNTQYRLYFGSANGGYKVFKISPQTDSHIISFATGSAYEYGYMTDAMDDFPSKAVIGQWSGVLEVYGNLPYITRNCSARTCKFLQSFDVTNPAPNALNYAFAYCDSLVSIDVSTWDTSNCTNFDSAFRDCPLISFNGYEDLDVSNATNFSNAFTKIGLKHFDMSKWNIAKVTGMGSMFADGKIESIKLKKSEVNCDYNNLFARCRKLTTIDMSLFVGAVATNVRSFFQDCTDLPNADLTGVDCSAIVSTDNSSNIYNAARNLKSITIPTSLTILGNYALANTERCTEFHFLTSTPPTLNNTNVFNNMTRIPNKKIYVPYSEDHSVLEAYQTATNWSSYASYIVEEES